jgi:hypothetical protein
MRSLLLEFLRFNSLQTGIWRVGDTYLVAAGSDYPVRTFASPLQHEDFLDLMLGLRYQGSAEERLASLKKIGEVVANILGTDSLADISTGTFPLQLDLVVNPAEVAALPFEAATDSEGRPLFAREDAAVVLTRRVRHAFAEKRVRWPASPRVLYAWAAPPGARDVPSEEHQQALRDVLKPWIPLMDQPSDAPESNGVLTTLPEVTLAKLAEACREAVEEGKPFTHVHLLAHGYPVQEMHKQHFGIALHAEDGDLHAVLPEEVGKALAPLVGHTVVVTLATCDAANLTNTITSRRSIAHELHELGFPIVVASQFPFTKPGSTMMVEIFYKALLGGDDVRRALHQARVALYASREKTGHDWASLVGYARLPEGYADHLLDVRLECMLASLKTMQGWSDELVKRGSTDPALFDQVATQLQERIETLEGFLQETEMAGRSGALDENLGLLGSAEKRLAELYSVRAGLGDAAHWQPRMREALERARKWYARGAETNLSHHWTGVQSLSLDSVLDGRIADARSWHAAVRAAQIDKKRAIDPQNQAQTRQKIWALGSLVELYLLAPLAGQTPPALAASSALAEMKALVQGQTDGDTFPLESTERQLRRYVQWWTTANGFFPGTSDLASNALSLLKELRR